MRVLAFREGKMATEVLNQQELLEDFEYWLKKAKGISGFPKAGRQRDAIRHEVRKALQGVVPFTPEAVLEAVKARREGSVRTTERDDPLGLFLEFFESEYYTDEEPEAAPEEPAESPPEEPLPAAMLPAERSGTPRTVIGRVALTIRSPARTGGFAFWVEDNPDIHLEAGTLVTAESPDDSYKVRVTGIVIDVHATSDVETPIDSFYGHGYGNPQQQVATKLTVVTVGEVETVYRSDGRAEPVRGNWPVFFADATEIRQAYGAEIDPRYEVVGGFTYDYGRRPVAIPLDVRYLVGYEAAHVNIAGTSGAATKTSYGLFLLLSLLAYGGRPDLPDDMRDGIAAVAFNVKEADLMRIDRMPQDWDEVRKRLQSPRHRNDLTLWEALKDPGEQYPIDPLRLKERFRFFAPQTPTGGLLTARQYGPTEGFSYACMDLAETRSLHMLLDPKDLDDLSTALISDLTEVLSTRKDGGSFSEMLELLQRLTKTPTGKGLDRWVSLGPESGTHHHLATVNKVLNRLQNAIGRQLSGLLNQSDLRARPIPVHTLRPGDLWVIDISKVHDKGQRLIFHTVVRTIYRILESKRTNETRVKIGPENVDVSPFPGRVVVFVDELNKFAPGGREYSAIKEDILEVTARGRSVGLSLIGIQQLASKVDDEVLANSNTLVIGRTHAAEIRSPAYNWLPQGLKERAVTLDKGWMLLWHAVHKRPVFLRFPVPLHFLEG